MTGPTGRSRSTRAPAFYLVTLLAQERAVDLLGVQIDIAGRHTAGPEVVFPALDDPRHGTNLPDGVIFPECEHLTHRQRVRDRRIGLLLTDTHLLESERLSG